MARQLTLKQQRFVRALPTAPSARQAAIQAGYSPTSAVVRASETIRKSNVAAAVGALVAKAEDKAIATVAERKMKLSDILRCPVVPANVPVHAIIAASDQLNRMDSLYVDKVAAISVHVDALDAFSVDELRQLLGKMSTPNDEKAASPRAGKPTGVKPSRRRKP